MGSEVVNNTHLFGYSSCQVLGACSHRNLPGSACQGGPNNGFCYEAANAVVQAPLWASSTGLTPRTRLTCGRLIETFDHFGPGVNPPIHVDVTARSCPRGTPGGATGRIHTVKRFLYAGCMLSSDAKYEPAAEVHVPAMCAVPLHWRQGCLFPGALNYMPGAKESGRCYYKTVGCMDSTAINYNSEATDSDGSCIAKVLGCTVGEKDILEGSETLGANGRVGVEDKRKGFLEGTHRPRDLEVDCTCKEAQRFHHISRSFARGHVNDPRHGCAHCTDHLQRRRHKVELDSDGGDLGIIVDVGGLKEWVVLFQAFQSGRTSDNNGSGSSSSSSSGL
jgi:hypothetical protein